jgi:hypothetical protein
MYGGTGQGEDFQEQERTWLDELEAQLFGFPYGKQRDMLDAFSQLCIWAMQHERQMAQVTSPAVEYAAESRGRGGWVRV